MKFSEYYTDKNVVESYDKKRLSGIKAPLTRKLERFYVTEMIDKRGRKILEAGVGTGYISEVLKDLGKFEGFDISNNMLNKTKSKFKKIKLFQADILKLKLKGKYEYIVSMRVISHFQREEAIKALKNLYFSLNNNGFIIFNLENKSFFRKILRKIANWGSTETYQYSSKEVNEIMSKTNLRIVEKIYLDHLFFYPLYLLNKIFFNKLEDTIFTLERKTKNISLFSNNILLKCQK